MNYNLRTPCSNCPFRRDVTPYLRADRVREIFDNIERGEFPCHKTTVCDEASDCGEMVETPKSEHCAGMLIMLEKMGRPSQMMRICERLGKYDASKLNMDAPVYEDDEECEYAQEAQ